MVNINKIQEVKERADIIKVAYYFGIKEKQCCPFHAEKTASFSINKNKQIFKCFGCGIGGDCITLVSKLLNVNAYEAAQNINEILGLGIDFERKTSQIEIDKYRYQQKIKEDYKKWQIKAFNILCNYYHYLCDAKDLEEKYQNIDKIDYFLEILRDGTDEDKKQFYMHERKWVKELGKRGFG